MQWRVRRCFSSADALAGWLMVTPVVMLTGWLLVRLVGDPGAQSAVGVGAGSRDPLAPGLLASLRLKLYSAV